MRIDNRTARHLFLSLHGLSAPPARKVGRAGLPELVRSIGFVQVDSIRTIERAHHHILFSRLSSYRPDWLAHHLEHERSLFENWTHDASIIPVEFYPYWKPRFERHAEWIMSHSWWQARLGDDHEAILERVRSHVEETGPLRTRDLTSEDGDEKNQNAWWGWRPSKSALEFLWRTGTLAVTRREGFQKVYDLTERVIPEQHHSPTPSQDELVEWACSTAMQQLGIASHGELANYFESIRPAEAKSWCERVSGDLIRPVEVEMDDGEWRPMFARADIAELLAEVPDPVARLRIISPFDPMIRDRKRTLGLFGFDYRIEVFVPEPQRQYGYYVFPILEGDRLIGRINMKTDRGADTLRVLGIWLEGRLSWSAPRRRRLDAELERWRRYLGLSHIAGALPGNGK